MFVYLYSGEYLSGFAFTGKKMRNKFSNKSDITDNYENPDNGSEGNDNARCLIYTLARIFSIKSKVR